MTKAIQDEFIFNGALESGIRAICVLSAGFELKFDLQQLIAFDHLIVHSGDVADAPESLHPKVSQRNGELLVRRQLIEQGLLLMESKHLVEKASSESGFEYSATELALVLLENLDNNYVADLTYRANWAVERYKNSGEGLFSEIFNTAFDRWTNEFQISEIRIGNAS